MKHSKQICLALWICLLPWAAWADDTSNVKSSDQGQGVLDTISQYLSGQSILLGAAYSQGTFKINNSTSRAQLTDNGRATAIVDYASPEHVLGKMDMKYGDAVLGMNITGSFGQQRTDFQNVSSGIIGTNVGTKVTGDYLAGAPFLYMRLGPVYPGTDSYWLVGYGVGAALWHFSGDALIGGSSTPTQLNSSSKLFLYQTARWQFHYGNFDLLFTAKILNNGKVHGYNASYEDYGIGVAYNFHF